MNELASNGNENTLEVMLARFHKACPKGRLIQKVVQLTDKLAIMEARLYLSSEGGEDGCVSNSHGMAVRESTDRIGEYIRQAENTAVWQALFNAGFGFSGDESEATAERKILPVPIVPDKAKAVEKESKPKEKLTIEPISVPSEEHEESIESIMKDMTLRDAVKLVVEVGSCKGKTLGQIAKENPKQLYWFRDSYKGPDNQLRAAATLLLREADIPQAQAA